MATGGQARVVGAFLVGIALVAGAFVWNRLSPPAASAGLGLYAVAAEPAPRAPIPVFDSDGDGIEDWRVPFLSRETVYMNDANDEEYVPGDTLTEQVSVNFMERILLSKGQGQFGRTTEEIVRDTAARVNAEGVDTLYRAVDITVTENTPENIRAYANAVASAIIDNSERGLRNELLLLKDALDTGEERHYEDLSRIARVYERTRDTTLNIPVPHAFAKQHLDMINAYHALHKDIEAMSKAGDDPLLALVRLKRYEDDANGLGYVLRSLYLALEPHAHLFTTSDPAVLFVAFRPE